ncbi:MAG: hypothetical protein R2705_08535 [Ilumatobacteraceae bacterium]
MHRRERYTAHGHELLMVVESATAEHPAGSVYCVEPGETVEVPAALAYRVTVR